MFNVMTYQTKNWTALTYPESFDTEELAKRFKYARISFSYIVHDKDVWTENDEDIPEGVQVGDPKKPHVHWCVRFPSKKTGKVVCTIFDKNRVLPMRPDVAVDYRYLCHLDDPDKFQYSPKEIVTNEPEFCEPYLYDLQDTSAPTADTLMDDVMCLVIGAMTYGQFYARHPDMLRRANTVEVLKRQFQYDYDCQHGKTKGDTTWNRRSEHLNLDSKRPRLAEPDVPEGTF